jgi:hypothetical protein
VGSVIHCYCIERNGLAEKILILICIVEIVPNSHLSEIERHSCTCLLSMAPKIIYFQNVMNEWVSLPFVG